jgi:hypothetical protein
LQQVVLLLQAGADIMARDGVRFITIHGCQFCMNDFVATDIMARDGVKFVATTKEKLIYDANFV